MLYSIDSQLFGQALYNIYLLFLSLLATLHGFAVFNLFSLSQRITQPGMKKAFRPQASSGRAFGGSGFGGAGGGFGSGFGVSSSPLSWIAEPPDLSNISDPNVGVAFKNLTKKDSTTKAKALEELLAFVSAPEQQVEEAVLEAWV